MEPSDEPPVVQSEYMFGPSASYACSMVDDIVELSSSRCYAGDAPSSSRPLGLSTPYDSPTTSSMSFLLDDGLDVEDVDAPIMSLHSRPTSLYKPTPHLLHMDDDVARLGASREVPFGIRPFLNPNVLFTSSSLFGSSLPKFAVRKSQLRRQLALPHSLTPSPSSLQLHFPFPVPFPLSSSHTVGNGEFKPPVPDRQIQSFPSDFGFHLPNFAARTLADSQFSFGPSVLQCTGQTTLRIEAVSGRCHCPPPTVLLNFREKEVVRQSMGRRGAKNKGQVNTTGSRTLLTLREESSGRKQTKSSNVKSVLKMQHLQKLAVWASRKASVPSLGAFFGHCLAACGEAVGWPTDSSLFPCERCETILQPGYNCTIRVEKNSRKGRHRRKKPDIPMQNNVVYKCHFCSHWNIKIGTPEGHMKEICPLNCKPCSKLETAKSIVPRCGLEKGMRSSVEVDEMDHIASTTISGDIPMVSSPEEVYKKDEITLPTADRDNADCLTTPLVRKGATLLEGRKRKRQKPGSRKTAEFENISATTDAEKSVSTSNKRRRKWTSLREIAQSTERDKIRSTPNLAIPFCTSVV
ncbi:uncharacterized protein LOC131148270 [Malania oleifera]|uniref:uncharacterized protein LOC131148270 n=1 Tax=Malania oleifera TaxID=397392 RepID=UPI0025AE6599|nr:uncharacterized protein LOC131148270 [Malania oleifera]